MAELTADLMEICTGCNPARAALAVASAEEALRLYDLRTVNQIGMFLANVGHETGNLRYNTELWGPTDAQSRYDTRTDLGNLYLGDGYKYRGRGWFQTTGRANYKNLRDRLRARFPFMQVPDFLVQPDLLAQTQWCAISAVDYWDMRNLNKYAVAGDFDGVADVINLGHKTNKPGDANGFKDRNNLWQAARPALILAGFPEA